MNNFLGDLFSLLHTCMHPKHFYLGMILDELVEEIAGDVEESLRHVAGEGLVRVALDGVVGIVDGGLALVLPEPGQHLTRGHHDMAQGRGGQKDDDKRSVKPIDK